VGATSVGVVASSELLDPTTAAAPLPSVSSSCLQVLSVAGCFRVTDEGLTRVVESPLGASLTELDVSGTSATEKILVQIAAAAANSGNPAGRG
ncbi:unnamed protein product, partial [Laminaria digitata]